MKGIPLTPKQQKQYEYDMALTERLDKKPEPRKNNNKKENDK